MSRVSSRMLFASLDGMRWEGRYLLRPLLEVCVMIDF